MWMHVLVTTCSKYNNSYLIIVKLPGPSQNEGSIVGVLIQPQKIDIGPLEYLNIVTQATIHPK